MNVNLESLKKTHGDNAGDIFRQVAELTGAGHPGDNHDGGIDCSGCNDAMRQKIDALVKSKAKKEGEN